jgi:sugar phosphate isomerase/epimerase
MAKNAARQPPPSHQIGLSTAALYPTHLTEDALTTIAQLGFRVAEVFLQAEEEYTPAFGAELDRRRRALGLRVHSLHLYASFFDLWSPYPRLIRETRDRFRRLLEVATILEVRALTWHGLRYGVDNPRLVAAFFDSAAWAGEQAQAAGVTLCIENVSWCYLRTPKHVQTILQAGLPVGFTFDAFQAGETGTDPATLIRAMDSRLTTVHLADYAPNGPRHLPPGKGALDWPVILRALQEVGYEGPLLLEPAHVTDTATFLRARDFVQRTMDAARSASPVAR